LVRYSDIYDKLSGPEGDDEPVPPKPEPGEPIEPPEVEPTSTSDTQPRPDDFAETDRPDDSSEPVGVSDAERDVLGELTGLGITSDDTDSPQPDETAPNHVPISEQQMLDELDAVVSAPDQPVDTHVPPDSAITDPPQQDNTPPEHLVETASPTSSIPVEGPLTEAETVVREDVIQESDRVLNDDLPHMFADQAEQPVLHDEPEAALVETDAPHPGIIAQLAALPMNLLNLPARWLGPAVVTGLGLAGIFLLIALFVVILVQTIMS